MSEMRRFGPADLMLLLLVLAVAAGARVGYLMTCADGARSPGPLRVQEAPPKMPGFTAPKEMRGHPEPTELDALIDHVRTDRWFGAKAPFAPGEETTAHVAPGYPWLVGELGRLVGAEKLDSTVRWVQAALGSLAAGFYFLFARRAFRSLLVGTLAGLFTALHPFWVIATATIDDGVLASFALAACLLLASQAGEKGGPFKSLVFGLALAGLALVRASMLPFAFVALVWFLIRSQSLSRGWLCALLAFLGFANGLAPWTVRNVQALGEPVPVVSSVWLHLWVGNNPVATGGPATPATWETAPKDELAQVEEQPARYAKLGKLVMEEVRNDPAAALKRRLYAAITFFVGERWLKDGTLAEVSVREDEETPAWLERCYPAALQGTLLAMLLLGVLGWRWSYGWRWESIPAALAAMWVPVPYILGHAEALSGPRLPLDGVLLCFTAFALVCLIPAVGSPLLQGAEARKAQTQG
jgi:hypothetical protein